MVAASRGNRSTGYPIGTDLIPSGFSGSFAEWFATQPLGSTTLRVVYLLSIYMCVSDTNISVGTYSAFGVSLRAYHIMVLLQPLGLNPLGFLFLSGA